jgi:hypothetical protein
MRQGCLPTSFANVGLLPLTALVFIVVWRVRRCRNGLYPTRFRECTPRPADPERIGMPGLGHPATIPRRKILNASPGLSVIAIST